MLYACIANTVLGQSLIKNTQCIFKHSAMVTLQKYCDG